MNNVFDIVITVCFGIMMAGFVHVAASLVTP